MKMSSTIYEGYGYIDEGLMVLCKTVLQLGIRIWVRMAKGLEMMMMKR